MFFESSGYPILNQGELTIWQIRFFQFCLRQRGFEAKHHFSSSFQAEQRSYCATFMQNANVKGLLGFVVASLRLFCSLSFFFFFPSVIQLESKIILQMAARSSSRGRCILSATSMSRQIFNLSSSSLPSSSRRAK